MKQITAEDVRLLQKETGEGVMACKKLLVERYKAKEKEEMINNIKDIRSMMQRPGTERYIVEEIVDVLDYLVRRS
jgi:hypothetical protein